MEQSFAVKFDDVRHEQTVILLLPPTDSDISRQSKFTDYKIDIL